VPRFKDRTGDIKRKLRGVIMKPTEEQKRIIKDFKDTRVMKINAVAGSGKTSTLEMLAKAYKKPSLYMAFNKGIATEASERFPSHVECRTTHSLAFAGFGRDIMHKLTRPKAYKNVAATPSEIAVFYNIDDNGDMSRNTVALFVKIAVQRFEQSAETKISKKHLPFKRIKESLEAYEDVDKESLTNTVLKVAKKHWENRIDPMSDVMASHDTYLKLWQLSRPILDYEILYVDEAQDTNPVVLDVVRRQTHSKVVYVGDTYQSIYQFRGAVNAMEMISAPTNYLSMSFRYGQEIADIASVIIDHEIDIKGNPEVASKVTEVDTTQQYTKLYRTNGKLLEDAVMYAMEGHKIKCEIDVWGFINLLKSTEALKNNDKKNIKP